MAAFCEVVEALAFKLLLASLLHRLNLVKAQIAAAIASALEKLEVSTQAGLNLQDSLMKFGVRWDFIAGVGIPLH